MTYLEKYFNKIKENIIGNKLTFETPYGEMPLVYADWTASGRIYKPIEDLLLNSIAPFVANTHTDTNVTGSSMTLAYKKALKYIKNHVGAHESDVIISSYSGMTGLVNKFQRMLGLRIHEKYKDNIKINDRPIVFITHMEHHSNQTSWIETIADVEIIRPDGQGLPDLFHLELLLIKYKNRKEKIAAITSCSNVTGVMTQYHDIAEIMHREGGYCFVDFAASAPYINIRMRQDNPVRSLDAIYFSPHKFLGGPGSSGILVFDPKLYRNQIPDNPGGGTVAWTNPWGEHNYVDDIETREDGGTPAFLQTIKAAMALKLKEEMGVDKILEREHEILEIIFPRLEKIPGLSILAGHIKDRLGIISFYVEGIHYNLIVKLLNDRFGIQVRGGCSCAGTYGHYLLNVSYDYSHNITCKIDSGDLSDKPGWVRLSIHPTMLNEEISYICDAIEQVCLNISQWSEDYNYDNHSNEFIHKSNFNFETNLVNNWFNIKLM